MKRCTENIQQNYWRTFMQKSDFKATLFEIALWHWCSPGNLLHIFRTPFPKNTSRGHLLYYVWQGSNAASPLMMTVARYKK